MTRSKSLVSSMALLLMAGLGLAVSARAQPVEPGCRPEMARLGLPIHRAQLARDEAKLTFVGHATFLIETPGGVRIATDYNDYARPSATPDIATMNKAHSTHNSRHPEPAIKHVLPGWDPSGRGAARPAPPIARDGPSARTPRRERVGKLMGHKPGRRKGGSRLAGLCDFSRKTPAPKLHRPQPRRRLPAAALPE